MTRAGRAGERGLSIIEALVMLAATALVAALLLPMTARGLRDDFGLAGRSLNTAEAGRAEASFRALVESAVQPVAIAGEAPPRTTLSGSGEAFTVLAGAPRAMACGGGQVTLRLETRGQDGRLLCTGVAQTAALFTWREARAQFSYSADGRTWSSIWPQPNSSRLANNGRTQERDIVMVIAPLVRLEIVPEHGRTLLWIERAGATAPFVAPPIEAAAPTETATP